MRKTQNLDILIEKLSKGNKSAFEKLFRLYYSRLNKYAFYFLKNQDEAEDLVQDVFFQIWLNRDKLKSEKNFAPYIFTLVKNRCLNALKRKVIEDKYILSEIGVESEELYHISFEMEDNFSSMEEKLNTELENIILEMPQRCSTAFRLKWFEGKKIREIAEIMKISNTMVDKHLSKGLQIAKKKLSPEMFLFLFIMQK